MADGTTPRGTTPRGTDRRRTFGPVVLAGLAGAAAAAIAGSKDWVSSTPDLAATASTPALDAPGVTALALVALAGWGAALATRGPVRRVILLIAALAGLAGLPVAWGSLGSAHDNATSVGPMRGDSLVLSDTVWPWIAMVGLALTLVAAVGGVLLAPHWPEMGRKYDAPTGADTTRTAVDPAAPEEQSNLDLWKSIDEGHDPTAERPE